MNNKWVRFILILLFLSGCKSGREERREIRVSGAWALYPMMLVWAEEYGKVSGVKVEVAGGGAGKGVSDVLSGQVDIGMVSRPIREEEIKEGAFYVAVTKDAVVATINSKNPIIKEIYKRGLTKEELRKIFMGEIKEWGEIVGKELKDDKIIIYGRSDASGAAQVWAEFLGNYTQGDCKEKAHANFDGDQAVALAVSREKNSIGFNNLNYAYNIETGSFAEGIRPVPIDLNENGTLDPDEDFYSNREKFVYNVSIGKYPSPPARFEYLVSKGPFKGEAKKFVEWILNEGQKFIEESGYIKLSPEKLQEEIETLNRGRRK
ncbi:MAG: substrate-binding domain-containing protein [candidate division WOR-3 bacterium]